MFWHSVLSLGVIQSILVLGAEKRRGPDVFVLGVYGGTPVSPHKLLAGRKHSSTTWSCHVFLTCIFNCPETGELPSVTADSRWPLIKLMEPLLSSGLPCTGKATPDKKGKEGFDCHKTKLECKLYNWGCGSCIRWIFCFCVRMDPAEQISFDSWIKLSI